MILMFRPRRGQPGRFVWSIRVARRWNLCWNLRSKSALKIRAENRCWSAMPSISKWSAMVSLTVADHFRPQINKLDWHVTSHLWLIQASHVNQAYLSEVPSGQLTDWGWPMLSGIISAQIFSTKFEHKIWARIFSGASAQTKILNVQISTVTI